MARRKILILDDDYEVLEALTLLMEYKEYSSVTLSAVGEIDILKNISLLKPDLILLDINLGDVNGIELCRSIKKSPLTARYRIGLMSAGNYDGIVNRSFCDFFIRKPFENEQLMQVIESLVN